MKDAVRQGALPTALGALGFFLPFSSAGVSLALAAVLVLAVMRLREVLPLAPWKDPVMAAGLVLFCYIAVHTLLTTGVNLRTLETANQYHELLFAPLLLALMHDPRHRQVFIRALLLGATMLAAVQWIALEIPELGARLASRRISASFALAVCAYVALMRSRTHPHPWPQRALAAFLASTVLFAIEGRTGHVVLLLLVACAAWFHSPPRWRWPSAIGGTMLAVVLALNSAAVVNRLNETLAKRDTAKPVENMTSTEIRIELVRLATDLSRQYGATGAGFANFTDVHEQAGKARYSRHPETHSYLMTDWLRIGNPHNEYFMQLIGGGVASLALFLGWLALALRQAGHAPPPQRPLLTGVCLAFAFGSLFNSMLLDFGEGHFYMAVLAWLLAEIHYPAPEADNGRQVRSVLVVATRQIGDVLLTTPLIRSARERWPEARIDVLGFRGTLGILRGNPDLNGTIESPSQRGVRGLAGLIRRLWRNYDLALVTDPGDRAHLMGWLAASRRCGIVPAAGGSNWWKKKLLDHVVVAAGDSGSVHTTVEKQSLLAPWAGVGAMLPQVVGPAAAPLPTAIESQLAPGAVVVHAPSMWPYKQWPIAHFRSLVTGLLAQGRQVVLTGSGSARDQECIAPLRGLAPPPQLLDLSGQIDFNQLATLLKSAALYIGPDTSVSHLAAATGVPVIAILGPTNPQRWAPWPARAGARDLFARSAGVQHTGNVTVLQGSLACVPCGRAGCEDHRQSRSDCLVDITPQRVLDQAVKTLAGA